MIAIVIRFKPWPSHFMPLWIGIINKIKIQQSRYQIQIICTILWYQLWHFWKIKLQTLKNLPKSPMKFFFKNRFHPHTKHLYQAFWRLELSVRIFNCSNHLLYDEFYVYSKSILKYDRIWLLEFWLFWNSQSVLTKWNRWSAD